MLKNDLFGMVTPPVFYAELRHLCQSAHKDHLLLVGILEIVPENPALEETFLHHEPAVLSLISQMLTITFNTDELVSYNDSREFLIAFTTNKINIHEIIKQQLSMIVDCVNAHFALYFKVAISFSYTFKNDDVLNYPDQLIDRARKSSKLTIGGHVYQSLGLES